jgi:hypothetical protein
METWANISRSLRIALLYFSTFGLVVDACGAQPPTPTQPASAVEPHPQSTGERALPEINSLMQQVEDHQKAELKTIRDYIYHSSTTDQDLDSHGTIKKTSTQERENFWVNGTYISKLLTHDGKPLSADELKKQSDRIDERIAAAKERDALTTGGQAPAKRKDDDEITFARFLELGAFSNERRVSLNGRDTIAIDYAGDPGAKTRNLLEGAVHDLAGTVWVDEQDRALVRVEGHFFNDFKVGGGLLADIHKGSSFQAQWIRINNEAWLPASFSGRGSARIALFFNHTGAVESRNSDYRKFHTATTILPATAFDGTPENPGATPSAMH